MHELETKDKQISHVIERLNKSEKKKYSSPKRSGSFTHGSQANQSTTPVEKSTRPRNPSVLLESERRNTPTAHEHTPKHLHEHPNFETSQNIYNYLNTNNQVMSINELKESTTGSTADPNVQAKSRQALKQIHDLRSELLKEREQHNLLKQEFHRIIQEQPGSPKVGVQEKRKEKESSAR